MISNILQLSTIWAETADNARSAARSFVLGGLSEKYYGLSDFWVADRINVFFLALVCFDKFLSSVFIISSTAACSLIRTLIWRHWLFLTIAMKEQER